MSLEWAHVWFALHARVLGGRRQSLATGCDSNFLDKEGIRTQTVCLQVKPNKWENGCFWEVFILEKKVIVDTGAFPSSIAGRVFPRRNFIFHKGNFSHYAFTLCIGKHATVNLLSCTRNDHFNFTKAKSEKHWQCLPWMWSELWNPLVCGSEHLNVKWPSEATGMRIGLIWREEHCLLDTEQS